MGDEKLSKKDRKGNYTPYKYILGRIAEQFLGDDQGEGLTNKKFVEITDKRRRMGIKKRYLKGVMKFKKRGVRQ
jgi:hypothetical protein